MDRSWAFVVILACLGQAAVMGNELTELGVDGGTAELEARIDALEEQLAERDAEAQTRGESVSYLEEAHQPAAPSACSPCGPRVGYDFACGRCRTTGFYGGAEIMWLKPFGSGDVATRGINAYSADTFLPGWRLWGGNQNCDGLGWRVNWWQWDQFYTGATQTTVPSQNTDTLRLSFQKLDLLVTQMVSFRNWDLMLLGGATYAGNTFSADTLGKSEFSDLQSGNSRSRFDGWGLTAGLLAYRDIAWLKGLKGFGSAQWSGVYGNTSGSYSEWQTVPPTPSTVFSANSTLLNILELKIGTQYERTIGRGAIGFVSAGLEAQYWSGAYMVNPFGVGGNNDLGLVGFTVGTGIRR